MYVILFSIGLHDAYICNYADTEHNAIQHGDHSALIFGKGNGNMRVTIVVRKVLYVAVASVSVYSYGDTT